MDKPTEKLLSKILETVSKISNKLDEHTIILNQHTEILNQHSEILGQHSDRLTSLENIVGEHGQKIQNIENIVTRIELEHGEKLQALFNCFAINNEKFIKINEEISRINTILDRQDNKIFYLDYYKNQTNLPQKN